MALPTPYLGEIRMFAGHWQPKGWHFCDGSLLSIAQNAALFSLLGTTYGGDGQATFALPDLRGRVPMHRGNNVSPGMLGGTETVTLTQQQLPLHNHLVGANSGTPADLSAPASNTVLGDQGGDAQDPQPYAYVPPGSGDQTSLAANSLQATGGSLSHENMQPFLVISYIIALEGIFPSQT
jgi:microcystin-dependent protein